VREHYPWALQAYDALTVPIMRADFSRLFYMHKYGEVAPCLGSCIAASSLCAGDGGAHVRNVNHISSVRAAKRTEAALPKQFVYMFFLPERIDALHCMSGVLICAQAAFMLIWTWRR